MVSGGVDRYHRRMRKISFSISILGSLLALSNLSASAEEAQCQPSMKDGWIRLGPTAMPMMAGFGKITNACNAPAVVVAASSPSFAEVSLHETRIENDMSRMREVRALRLSAGETAVLAPGGMHLMLMQPIAALKAGDKVMLKLKLQDGRELPSELVVRKSVP